MKKQIAIIGLGYVGLPLALEFGRLYPTIGFDINPERIAELTCHQDSNLQATPEAFKKAKLLSFSNKDCHLAKANIYIITVPTPIDAYKNPDISTLLLASRLVGKYLKKGDIVIYESTTYPTCTQNQCVPELESSSHLIYNQDFFVGYSPERINPGDTQNTLTNIIKITSGSTEEVAKEIDSLYQSIISAGTYLAPSIEVAEAAKSIENAQRDLNIAFMNELSLIFERLHIDTYEVLKAAQTKWNFLNFTPGLVGGHCIGVDPYYLTHIATSVGYHPKIISAGRYINDYMPTFVASKTIKLLAQKNIAILGAKILILGITFKENCPDIRNSKVVEVIKELKEFGCDIEIYDPFASWQEVQATYHLSISNTLPKQKYDGVILCVAHSDFLTLNPKDLIKQNGIIYDLKGIFSTKVDARL